MSDTVINKLKELKIEDNIWIIYLGIIFLSFYSNQLERNYFIHNDLLSKKKYQEIMIIIFTILVIIYFYFLYNSYQELKKTKFNNDNEKKRLIKLAFIASFLLTISGLIYLYIAIKDNDINVELAFN